MFLMLLLEYVVFLLLVEVAFIYVNTLAMFVNAPRNVLIVYTVSDFGDVADVGFYDLLWLLFLLESVSVVVTDIISSRYLRDVHQCS